MDDEEKLIMYMRWGVRILLFYSRYKIVQLGVEMFFVCGKMFCGVSLRINKLHNMRCYITSKYEVQSVINILTSNYEAKSVI